VPSRPAGAGIYTLELAAALRSRDDIELLVASPDYDADIVSPASNALERSAWEQLRLSRLMATARIDVYHGAHFAVPVGAGIPCIATVHDLTFYRLPRRYSLHRRLYYRALAETSRRATRIIVPSKAVAADVVRYLNYPLERVRIIAEAPRSGLAPAPEAMVADVCRRLHVERPYLLCVGTAEPGKRAVDAVRAIVRMQKPGPAPQLVLAGNEGPLSKALRREAARLGVAGRVRFVGYVGDADLSALYTGATALVFPSLYEGFGLPPLEAMACGAPVIASKAPAMTEVLGQAAIFVPLRDPEAIAREASHLLTNQSERAEWSARGREHVARFSWTRAADETAALYHEVLRP
jgi:glycosyltransferase involved in cell wall biosynthesis